MKWSWKLARIAGIDLRIHGTFVILLAWLALVYYGQAGAAGAVAGVVFTLALFGSVVLHELGHALTARRFGVATRDITLLPIGGVARLESMPEDPRQELLVALAGPAVTAALAAALYGLLLLLGGQPMPMGAPSAARGSLHGFVSQLMWLNLILLGFNLLPAFPMDGGRVLRAFLAMRMDHGRATEHAAGLGKLFALAFGIIGLFYNPFLVLIALFVWLGAASEATSAQVRSTITGVPMERAMISDFRTLSPDDTLNVALDHVLDGFQEDFPVVDDGRVVGMLTRSALLRSVAQHGRDGAVADAMERTFPTVDIAEPLERALARLMESRARSMPVLSGGKLRGLLTTDNINELVMIERALRQAPGEERLAFADERE